MFEEVKTVVMWFVSFQLVSVYGFNFQARASRAEQADFQSIDYMYFLTASQATVNTLLYKLSIYEL